MILNKNCKIEKSASTDANRAVINQCFYNAETEKIYSTNGNMLAIVTAKKSEGDQSGFVSAESLKESRKTKNKFFELFLNGNIENKEFGKIYKRETEESLAKYPQVEQVIPKNDRKKITIALNPKLLLDLAESIDASEGVKIEIEMNDENLPTTNIFIVKCAQNKNDNVGYLMPMRVI